jgi:hypothetical protein
MFKLRILPSVQAATIVNSNCNRDVKRLYK